MAQSDSSGFAGHARSDRTGGMEPGPDTCLAAMQACRRLPRNRAPSPFGSLDKKDSEHFGIHTRTPYSEAPGSVGIQTGEMAAREGLQTQSMLLIQINNSSQEGVGAGFSRLLKIQGDAFSEIHRTPWGESCVPPILKNSLRPSDPLRNPRQI